jgi:thermitase
MRCALKSHCVIADAPRIMPRLHRAHSVAAFSGVVLALLGWVVPAQASASPQPVRLIVGFERSHGDAAQVQTLRSVGVGSAAAKRAGYRGIEQLDAAVVTVAAHRARGARAALAARPGVAWVEVDHVARIAGLREQAEDGAPEGWQPNDTLRSQQWSLDTIGVAAAWRYTRGTGVKIAILDTGVDYIHPDLAGRVDLGPDFVDNDDDPMDVQGHGTHVAGTAAAGTDDGFGIAGVAPGARILAVRVLDAEGAGNYSSVARGITYAADNGAKVINLSLGGPEPSIALREAIDYAASRGSIVVCATGNESASSVAWPGRYDSCTAVGATDPTDQHAPFSNTGEGIDITAPGVQILSSTMGAQHDAWDGTSMATPHVSGVAALLMASGLSRKDALETIVATARDLGRTGADTTFGAGRIDAGAALEAAQRRPRSSADAAAPVVTSVTAGAVKRTTRTTYRTSWKVASKGRFRRVGTTPVAGTYVWRQGRTVGARRIVHTYRATNGIVYRATTTWKRVRTPKRVTTTTVPIIVAATDDVGVDRVSVSIDGRIVGIDWSPAGGWSVAAPCSTGRVSVSATAWDAADRATTSTSTLRMAC